MKKLLYFGISTLVLGLSITSCNDDDDYQTIESIDKIKIDSVRIVNDTMDVFSVQSIKTYSTYPSHCEGFYGYDYIHTDSSTRTVTAYKYITNDRVHREVIRHRGRLILVRNRLVHTHLNSGTVASNLDHQNNCS
ncbi:hypothetical protein [Chryseobacterium wanjuense]